jgi:hypothetical protein
MTGDLLIEVQLIFYECTRKMWPFNTGDCIIEVTSWVGLTVQSFILELFEEKNQATTSCAWHC